MGLVRVPSRSSRRTLDPTPASTASVSGSTSAPSASAVSSPSTCASPTAAAPLSRATQGYPLVFAQPDLRRALARRNAQHNKLYMEGYLSRREDLSADGRPLRATDPRKAWSLCFVQLAGTVLSIWPVRALQAAAQEGTQVPPSYMDITDGVVDYVGELGEDLASVPNSKGSYENVFALCTAGGNRSYWCVEGQVGRRLVQAWVNALRLASWEKMRLEEMYTAALFRAHRFPPLGDKRVRRRSTLAIWGDPLKLMPDTPMDPSSRGGWDEDAPPDPGTAADFDSSTVRSPLTRGRLEGTVKARFMGSTQWKELYMVLATSPEEVRDHHVRPWYTKLGSVGSRTSLLPFHASGEFVPTYDPFLGISPPQGVTPTQGVAYFYDSKHTYHSGSRPCASIIYAAHVYAVYPSRDELVQDSTLFKIEGIITPPQAAPTAMGKTRMAGWALVMPESDTRRGNRDMMRWILATVDVFRLYGRPNTILFDPRDERSPFFAYPVGVHRDRLFLDREQSEFLEMDCDLLSQRYNLHYIMALRMQGKDTPLLSPLPQLNTTATSFLSAGKGLIIRSANQKNDKGEDKGEDKDKDTGIDKDKTADASNLAQPQAVQELGAQQRVVPLQERPLPEGTLPAVSSGLETIEKTDSKPVEGNSNRLSPCPSHSLLSPRAEADTALAFSPAPVESQVSQAPTLQTVSEELGRLSPPGAAEMHSVPSLTVTKPVEDTTRGASLATEPIRSESDAPPKTLSPPSSLTESGTRLRPIAVTRYPMHSSAPQGGYSPLSATPLVITNHSPGEQESELIYNADHISSAEGLGNATLPSASSGGRSPFHFGLSSGTHSKPRETVSTSIPTFGPFSEDPSRAMVISPPSLLSGSHHAVEPTGLPAPPLSPLSPVPSDSRQVASRQESAQLPPSTPGDLRAAPIPAQAYESKSGRAEDRSPMTISYDLRAGSPTTVSRIGTPASSEARASSVPPISEVPGMTPPLMAFPPNPYFPWPGMPMPMPGMVMPGMAGMGGMPMMPGPAGMAVPPMGSYPYPLTVQQMHAMQAAQAAYAQAMAQSTYQHPPQPPEDSPPTRSYPGTYSAFPPSSEQGGQGE